MLTEFLPFLTSHRATFIIDGDEDETTVTVLLNAKDKKDKDFQFQLCGPLAEVSNNITDTIRSAAKKIGDLRTTLSDLDKQIEDEKTKKNAILEAEKKSAKPAAKPAAKPEDTKPTNPMAAPKPAAKKPVAPAVPTPLTTPQSTPNQQQSTLSDLGI